jgi:hypothetical protein
MLRRILRSQLGQTSVEYVLLIAMSVTLGIAFMKKMDEYVISNPNGVIGKPLNMFKESLASDVNGRYSRFPLRR